MREIQVFSIANCQTESVYMEFKSEKNISTIVYDLDLSQNYLIQFPRITGRLVQISIQLLVELNYEITFLYSIINLKSV